MLNDPNDPKAKEELSKLHEEVLEEFSESVRALELTEEESQ